MGTISDKLNYLNGTKQRIKQAINKLGGNLTDQSTFRSYWQQLGQLYDRLPKTTYQEGTNINLGKTLKAVVQYEDDKVLYGDTEQESTTGKNMIPTNDIAETTINGLTYFCSNGIFRINGTASANTTITLATGLSIVIDNASGYRISVNKTGTTTSESATFIQYLLKSGNTILGYVNNIVNNASISNGFANTGTIDNVTLYIVSGTAFTNVTFKFQVESGSTATTWEKYTGGIASPNPSYPQPISVVTGTQEVVVRGKNLFDKDMTPSYTQSYVLTEPISTGIRLTWNSSTSPNTQKFIAYKLIDLSNYVGKTIRCKANFTASGQNRGRFYIGLCDSNGGNRDNIDTANNSGSTCSFIVPQLEGDIKYLCLALYLNRDASSYLPVKDDYIDYTDITITIDDEDMTYEPYITPTTYTLHLGNMEFAGIGDYQDYPYFNLDEGKWYKKVNISKKILNTSNVTIFAYNETNKYVNISKTTLNIPKGATTGTTLCSHFREVTNATDFVVGTYRNNGNVDNLWIKTPDSVTNLDEAKAYLNSYNATFYGTIRTPTDEEITDTTLIADLDNILAMMSVEGTTIIEVSGNLPAPIKVKAVKGE